MVKLNILRTNVSGITTNETFINGWDPIEITDNYMLSYLSIPFLINFRINRKYYLGTGISYDYLLNTKITKSVINSTDPVFERLSNTINPANHSFLIYLKYIFNDNLAISPTILLSPNKTNSQLFSNSTGPSMSFHFDLQLKI